MSPRPWLALALAFAGCRGGAATAGASFDDASVETKGEVVLVAPRDPLVEELWEQAKEGGEGDLARLHDREGDTGLFERAALPAYRMTALGALGCGDDFNALPFLAGVAVSGSDDEADVALASTLRLVAVPRRARDPEDALELQKGCEGLLALARQLDAPRTRRARAVSALRMLGATGCLHGQGLPTDLDAK